MKTQEASGKKIMYSPRTDHTEQYSKSIGTKELYKDLYKPLYKKLYS